MKNSTEKNNNQSILMKKILVNKCFFISYISLSILHVKLMVQSIKGHNIPTDVESWQINYFSAVFLFVWFVFKWEKLEFFPLWIWRSLAHAEGTEKWQNGRVQRQNVREEQKSKEAKQQFWSCKTSFHVESAKF